MNFPNLMHNEVTLSYPLPLCHWSFLYGTAPTLPPSTTSPSSMWSLGTEKAPFTGVKDCLGGDERRSANMASCQSPLLWLSVPWHPPYHPSSLVNSHLAQIFPDTCLLFQSPSPSPFILLFSNLFIRCWTFALLYLLMPFISAWSNLSMCSLLCH